MADAVRPSICNELENRMLDFLALFLTGKLGLPLAISLLTGILIGLRAASDHRG